MDQLRALLKARTQERGGLAQLAKQSGIPQNVIGSWISGNRRPSPENLKKLSRALGIPYDELMKAAGYLTGEATLPDDPQLIYVTLAWPSLPKAWRDVMEALARAGKSDEGSTDTRPMAEYVYQGYAT